MSFGGLRRVSPDGTALAAADRGRGASPVAFNRDRFTTPHRETPISEAPLAIAPMPEPADVPAPALPEWEMVADTDEVWTARGGWLHDSILRTQLDKWPDFLRSVEGSRALGQSHEGRGQARFADYSTHNTIMSFRLCAWARVAPRRESVSVLDWGRRARTLLLLCTRRAFPRREAGLRRQGFSGILRGRPKAVARCKIRLRRNGKRFSRFLRFRVCQQLGALHARSL